MSIRFLTSWNGYYAQQVVASVNGSTEAALVAAGIASYSLDGPAPDEGSLVRVNSTGTALVSGDEKFPILQDYFARRAPYGLALAEPPVSGLSAAAGAGVTINSSAAAVVNGETMWTVNATATSGSNNYF